jgi:hypothetical protein
MDDRIQTGFLGSNGFSVFQGFGRSGFSQFSDVWILVFGFSDFGFSDVWTLAFGCLDFGFRMFGLWLSDVWTLVFGCLDFGFSDVWTLVFGYLDA